MTDTQKAILFACLTALFWGVYGPVLQFGRSSQPLAAGGWSPFKPFVFIGVAYLVWACVGGAVAMYQLGDEFSFSGKYSPAMKWGFIAGSLGAFGALTLTAAVFNAVKAKSGPALVMPIVFGGAVTVSAITSILILIKNKSELHIDPRMWIGMATVVIGIVLVAKFAPHPSPPKKPAAPMSNSEPPAPGLPPTASAPSQT